MAGEEGALLRAIRTALGVSVAQVAEVSGMSAGTLKHLEQRGAAGSRRSTVVAVATALSAMTLVRLDQLVGDAYAPESAFPGTAARKAAARERRSKPAALVLRPAPPPPTLDDLTALLTDQAGLWRAAWELLEHARRQRESHDT